MNLQQYLDVIIKFLQDYLKDNHQDCYVLGISGGVDSSLVAALAKKAVGKDKLYCYALPIDSLIDDENDAVRLAKHLDVNYEVVDLSEAYHCLVNKYESTGVKLDLSTKGNLKARMRMATLYAFAQNKRGLVLGTDNMDERYTGYFTKFGDGGVDLLPIANLTKGEVVEACLLLGIPEDLAKRTPSAGLYQGQTDEKEMGITYKDLDDYLLGKEINEEAKSRIERLHRISEHKRKDIPTPEDYIRE
ncbi:MAG: NAD(+) synthase [Erysipelotrichaceae bacterium]|jgi:NAD+ synthase|nr:NAD(+) synthase [Erysipelotrichaceae bacterium]